jgi:hypothetical protein
MTMFLYAHKVPKEKIKNLFSNKKNFTLKKISELSKLPFSKTKKQFCLEK